MRESTPIFDERDARSRWSEGEHEAASCCTEIGSEDRDDLSLPVVEVIKTILFATVLVATTALIAALAQG